MKLLSCVQFFVTPWAVACQAPPSMGFSRQERWSGLPFPSSQWKHVIALPLTNFRTLSKSFTFCKPQYHLYKTENSNCPLWDQNITFLMRDFREQSIKTNQWSTQISDIYQISWSVWKLCCSKPCSRCIFRWPRFKNKCLYPSRRSKGQGWERWYLLRRNNFFYRN